jgi:uncharacterized peroxidase-related enzyme
MEQHGAVASHALKEDRTVQAVMEDWRTAPIPERLRVMLGFLEKMTLSPQELGPADVTPLREAGLSDEEITDAIHVCGAFNLINRLADALGWELQKDVAVHRFSDLLLSVGYKPPIK